LEPGVADDIDTEMKGVGGRPPDTSQRAREVPRGGKAPEGDAGCGWFDGSWPSTLSLTHPLSSLAVAAEAKTKRPSDQAGYSLVYLGVVHTRPVLTERPFRRSSAFPPTSKTPGWRGWNDRARKCGRGAPLSVPYAEPSAGRSERLSGRLVVVDPRLW